MERIALKATFKSCALVTTMQKHQHVFGNIIKINQLII